MQIMVGLAHPSPCLEPPLLLRISGSVISIMELMSSYKLHGQYTSVVVMTAVRQPQSDMTPWEEGMPLQCQVT